MKSHKLTFENKRTCTIECEETGKPLQDKINEAEKRFGSPVVKINDKEVKEHSLGGFLLGAVIGGALGNSVAKSGVKKTASKIGSKTKKAVGKAKKDISEFRKASTKKYSDGGKIEFKDGFTFKKVSKEYAEKNFENENIFGINVSQETESLIESKRDLDEFEVFGIELGFKDAFGDGGQITDKDLSYYVYPTKKVKIAYFGKIQQGSYFSLADALKEIQNFAKGYPTNELEKYAIVTPDKTFHLGKKQFPIRFENGGQIPDIIETLVLQENQNVSDPKKMKRKVYENIFSFLPEIQINEIGDITNRYGRNNQEFQQAIREFISKTPYEVKRNYYDSLNPGDILIYDNIRGSRNADVIMVIVGTNPEFVYGWSKFFPGWIPVDINKIFVPEYAKEMGFTLSNLREAPKGTDFEGNYIYADGGLIGKTAIFERYGEQKMGTITEDLGNGKLVVVSGMGQYAVTPDNLISITEPIEKKGFFSFGEGGKLKYNRSWHQDHYRHNKAESYEKPMSERSKKYSGGGGVSSVKKYRLLSPDGFDIEMDKVYTEEELMPAFEQFKKRFEKQGYYSTGNRERINLSDLADYMTVTEVNEFEDYD